MSAADQQQLSCDASASQHLSQDEKHLMNDEDSARDNLYARAEKISAELGIMTLELKRCIENVNNRADGQGEASDPLSKIVHILNNQLQALSNVDDGSEQVTKRLEQLTGTFSYTVAVFSHHKGSASLGEACFCAAFASHSPSLICCLPPYPLSFERQSAQSAPGVPLCSQPDAALST